jgi:enoyl-CoA hydratase/carnithine racemase
MVNRIVPADYLAKDVDALAHRLASGPTVALASAKLLLNGGGGRGLSEVLEDEARCQALAYGTKDAKEAISAFLEGRHPTFLGR